MGSDYPTFRAVARTLYPQIKILCRGKDNVGHASDAEFYCSSTRISITHMKDVTRVYLTREAPTLIILHQAEEIGNFEKRFVVRGHEECLAKYVMPIVFKEDHINVQFPWRPNAYEAFEFFYYDPEFDTTFMKLIRQYFTAYNLKIENRIEYPCYQ